MSDYIFSKIKLGDVLSFRYSSPNSPSRGFEPPKTVMVLAPNWQGHLHGIKMTGLTPTEQEYLQQLLQTAYSNPQNIFEPFEAQIQQRKKELDILNAQRNEMIKQGQRVVITPNPPNLQFMDKAKRLLGSVIGRVNTFGRTLVQGRPAVQENLTIQQQIQKNDQLIRQKKTELDTFVLNLNRQKAQIQAMPQIPTDPYRFYHMFLKSFIHDPKRMKQIYRKYNLAYIKTPRIVRTIGIIPQQKV